MLAELREGTQIVRELGSKIVPELDYKDLNDVEKRTTFRDKLHKRGVALIRGVVPEQEALDWKELVKQYVRDNPSVRGE